MEEINIKDFLQYLKKYVLMISIILFVSVIVVAVYDIKLKTPKYTTSTTIVLVKNETSSSKNEDETISYNDITLNQKLVSTYRNIIKSDLVLSQVINKLSLSYSVNELRSNIDVQAVADTEILKISVTDDSSTNAADIANKLADVFDKEITRLYNINNVSVIDRAKATNVPSNNTVVRDLALAVFVSVIGSIGVVFVIFYFDDRLRYTENMENEIGMPVIAKIFKDKDSTDLVTNDKPNALTSESIRTLRTNLQFSSIDKEIKTILVTSTLPAEGKSFISANLAISFAQTGKKVLIIDCDLRKGRQHNIFNIQNKKGLSNLLIKDLKNYSEYVCKTKIENVSVIPRGAFPPNPSELLNSKKNASLIEKVKKDFDIIILDGVPYNGGLSDSLILASLVDKVLIVSSVNYTPKTELKNVKKALLNVGADIAGCIANNINIKKDSYGGHYYYYYSYGYGSHNTSTEVKEEDSAVKTSEKQPKKEKSKK